MHHMLYMFFELVVIFVLFVFFCGTKGTTENVYRFLLSFSEGSPYFRPKGP